MSEGATSQLVQAPGTAAACGPGVAGRLAGWFTRSGALPLFVALLVAKQLAVLFALVANASVNLAPNSFFSCLGAALVLAPWALVARGRLQLAAMAALDALLAFVFHGNLLYHRQFSDLPSVAALRYAGLAGDVGGGIAHLVGPWDALLWVDVLALAALAVLSPRAVRERFTGLPLRRAAILAGIGAALAVSAAASTRYVYKPFGGHTAMASRLGLVGYHVYDGGSYLGRSLAKRFPSQAAVAEAERFFRGRAPAPSPLAGAARGRNVIFVQLESFQAFPVGLELGGRKVTPVLDALAQESVTFSPFYSQVGQGTTSDAELLALCSLYPARTGSVYYDHATNDYRCLPEILGERGYRTLVFHSNRPDYWNRAEMYPRLGFERYVDARGFVQDERIGMGLSDESFFRQVAEQLAATPEPYLGFAITLTCHTPFADPALPRELALGPLEGTFTGHYLHSVHYADRALGRFVEDLRARGILDRSVLVVYGDHQGLGRGNSKVGEELLHLAAADGPAWFEAERRVPMLVRLPGGAGAGRRPWPAGQIDVAPTIAGLLGIPGEGRLFLGQDRLAGSEGPIAFPNGSAVADGLLFLSGDAGARHGCFRHDSAEPLPREACADLAARSELALRVSGSVIESDLVPRLLPAVTASR